jgi:hypothetical protein
MFDPNLVQNDFFYQIGGSIIQGCSYVIKQSLVRMYRTTKFIIFLCLMQLRSNN